MPVPIDPRADGEAFAKQYQAEQAAQKAQEAPPEPVAPWKAAAQFVTSLPDRLDLPTLEQSVARVAAPWGEAAKRVGQDVVAGGVKGGVQAADTAQQAVASGAGATASPEMSLLAQAAHPLWEYAKNKLDDFTDAVKVKDPNLTDTLLQYTAQVAPSYAVYARSLGFLGGRLANLAGGAVADATALPENAPRFADMLQMAQHTDGKIGQALQAAGPYGVNLYINYLAHPAAGAEQETALEAHLKNGLDGLMPNGLGNELLHAAMVTGRQGMRVLRAGVDQGVASVGDLEPKRPPLVQAASDPADAIAEEQARKDMDAAAANPDRKRPPLVQGNDPADALYEAKAREDAEAASRNANVETSGATPGSSLEKDSALSMARTHVQTQSEAGREGASHDVVSALAQHIDASTEEGAFYKDIFGKLASKQQATRLVPPGTGPHAPADTAIAGQHNSGTDTTALYPQAFKSNKNFAWALAHEQVHAGTMKAVDSNPELRTGLTELIDRAGSSYQVAELAERDKYGLKSPREFVAEAEANPRFQKMLKSTNDADGTPLWDSYKKLIGSVFGISGATLASPYFDKLLTKEKST